MILMKDYLIEKARAGIKTETRRLGKKRWKVGGVYWVCRRLFQKEPDLKIRVLRLWQEKLSQITPEAVKREGLEGLTPAGFIEKFRMINEGKVTEPDPLVWVLQFELIPCWKCKYGPPVKGEVIDSCKKYAMNDQCVDWGYNGFEPKEPRERVRIEVLM